MKFPQFVDDAARAVRWAYDHAGEFNGDSHKLFLMGHSAGAHIAALLATDVRYLAEVNLRPHDLSGFIGLAGPYDFAPTQDPDLTPIFGDTDAEQELAQPVNFVRGDGPPAVAARGNPTLPWLWRIQRNWPKRLAVWEKASNSCFIRASDTSGCCFRYPHSFCDGPPRCTTAWSSYAPSRARWEHPIPLRSERVSIPPYRGRPHVRVLGP